MLAVAPWCGPAWAAEQVEVNLEVVGRSDLGGQGPFDDVAVLGRTAVVATGGCPGGTLTVVDLDNPRKPSVRATVPVPAGRAATDLDASAVATETFTGDLLAVALSTCAGIGAGVAYYDITVPAGPRLLAERPAPGSGSVSVAQRDGGGVVAVRPSGPTSLVVDDLSDPANPSVIGRWTAPSRITTGCGRAEAHVAAVQEGGRGVLVVFADGRVYDLELGETGGLRDFGEGGPPDGGPAGTSRYGAVMPVGTRTLAIVAGEGPDGACPGGAGPRLRVLELTRGGPPVEVEPVQFTTQAAPGRLVASGELAYVAWGGEGLRVVDMGQVRANVVAQFIPERAAVVAVALLDEHVLVVDGNAGLYVLERPDEGGAEASFWTDLVGFLPYLGLASVLAALFVVPRLAMGHAPGRSHVPSPVPERGRRRPA